jgi:hypothetical protein
MSFWAAARFDPHRSELALRHLAAQGFEAYLPKTRERIITPYRSVAGMRIEKVWLVHVGDDTVGSFRNKREAHNFAERVSGQPEHVEMKMYDSADMTYEQYMATHHGAKRMRTPPEWD